MEGDNEPGGADDVVLGVEVATLDTRGVRVATVDMGGVEVATVDMGGVEGATIGIGDVEVDTIVVDNVGVETAGSAVDGIRVSRHVLLSSLRSLDSGQVQTKSRLL